MTVYLLMFKTTQLSNTSEFFIQKLNFMHRGFCQPPSCAAHPLCAGPPSVCRGTLCAPHPLCMPL